MTSSQPHDGSKITRRLDGRLWRIGRVVAGAVWALLAAELFLRLLAPVPMLPRYVVATEFGIRGNQPNQSYVHRTPDYTIEIRTNSAGVRADEEIPTEKPPGIERIVVLGDSFSMGYGVNLEDTFLMEMKGQLEAQGHRIEIVNLSVSGHGNAEELVMLREEGLKYQPDLVLLSWHRTDLDDNVRSALFALDGDKLVRKNESFLPQVELRQFLFSIAAYRWLAGNSQLYNFLREGAAETAKSVLSTARSIVRKPRANDTPRDPVSGELSDPSMAVAGNDGRRDYRTRLTLALLGELRREASAVGAEFVVLDIPNTTGRSQFNSSFPDLAGTDIATLHLVSPLGKFESRPGELIYWERSHFHFTPLGCDLVGASLAEYIRDHELLTP